MTIRRQVTLCRSVAIFQVMIVFIASLFGRHHADASVPLGGAILMSIIASQLEARGREKQEGVGQPKAIAHSAE